MKNPLESLQTTVGLGVILTAIMVLIMAIFYWDIGGADMPVGNDQPAAPEGAAGDDASGGSDGSGDDAGPSESSN